MASSSVSPSTAPGSPSAGRSIDARGLGEDVLNGRAVTPQAADGFLYQSIGGRVTGEVLPRVRLYAGYSQDKNNRDAEPTGRTIVGGYASNVGGSGIDLSGSDSLMHRPNGSYHARYISAGHQIGQSVYVTGDYSTSLSVVRFSRSDGITIEIRPHATRISGTATINMRRAVSLLATVERTREDDSRDLRILTGITYRVR